MTTLCRLGTLCLLAFAAPAAAQQRTENVVLIVSDGVRWQEIFRGAERRLMTRTPGGVSDTTALIRDFWIDSNEFPSNPNVTVFEWLSRQPPFRDKVAAIATWGVFRNIFNPERAGFDVIAGWREPFAGEMARDSRRAQINELYRTSIKYWADNSFDAPMHLAAKEYIRARMPRVLFVGYGETDEWAHGTRYDLVLRSARQMDAFVADLWTTMQAMPQYRGKTTFIITTDHGRGDGDRDWRGHGADVAGAENIWIAVIGPDTRPLGERSNIGPVTQSQIAATVAAMLGLGDAYRASAPKAAAAIADVVKR